MPLLTLSLIPVWNTSSLKMCQILIQGKYTKEHVIIFLQYELDK